LSEPEILDGTISVHIIVGEGLGVYPIIQHESLELNHPNGGQAKFLESTLLESSPFMAERIGNRASGQATSGGEQGLGESE
jgi:hypothetical protein